jgi:hypothetical protein
MATWIEKGLPAAGLYAGPVAWLVSTQANYALVPWVCAHKVRVIPAVALALIAVSLFGAFLSWRAYAVRPVPPGDFSDGGRPRRFLAGVGILTAVLFALVIAVHGAAGLFFSGCER